MRRPGAIAALLAPLLLAATATADGHLDPGATGRTTRTRSSCWSSTAASTRPPPTTSTTASPRRESRGAEAVVVQLDTPGGLLESTKLIVKDMLGAPVPVVVYVAPSGAGATSAGVFVTMAANLAVMAPGTNIGAAHPVSGQGQNIGGDMREKAENFAASLGRTIAERRGRNVEWAEKAVRDSVSITESEAVKLKVVDFIADRSRRSARQSARPRRRRAGPHRSC